MVYSHLYLLRTHLLARHASQGRVRPRCILYILTHCQNIGKCTCGDLNLLRRTVRLPRRVPTHIDTRVYICMPIYDYTRIYVYATSRTRACAHARLCSTAQFVSFRTQTRAHKHTVCARTQTHTHTHARITHARVCARVHARTRTSAPRTFPRTRAGELLLRCARERDPPQVHAAPCGRFQRARGGGGGAARARRRRAREER
jgi:hypothetical protein